ncbi:MAG TPA: polyprenol monophosphomannose synthase [Tepidisphaeraceae bacterium]|jgi:dolichol-phosphate mannosyltransferase|nr:polyprenol monophosphomannose synthase [Tepidisphaeraceae bacterium]
MPTTPIDISLVIPALNEAPNLPALAERISVALGAMSYEILIIDDKSRDNTPDVCAQLSQKYPLRLIVRENPTNGLSGAVLHGIAQSRGRRIVVMDADLQHPPEKIPELLAALDSGADFALGSRYIPGGSTGQQWGVFRKINSWVATVLARPFAGRVNDPMSGFFSLDRATFDRAERLTPLGYKIALELICKCRVKQVREVPIHFAERTAGESKLSLKQQFRYLEHLSRLYDFTYPRLSPITKFLIVTSIAWLFGLCLFLAIHHLGLAGSLATTLAYGGSIFATAIFHARYVRTQHEFLFRQYPWLDFIVSSLAEWIACFAVALYVDFRVQSPTRTELFFLPFLAALFVRYILRKEFLLDIRGLRRDLRKDELL